MTTRENTSKRRWSYSLVVLGILLLSTRNSVAQVYTMTSDSSVHQVVHTCSGVFYDSGGPTGMFQGSENKVITFCSDDPSKTIFVDFVEMGLDTALLKIIKVYGLFNWPNHLYVYEGDSTTGYQLGDHTATPADMPSYSSRKGGCLTFKFKSHINLPDSLREGGWKALIHCGPPPNYDCEDKVQLCGTTTINSNSDGKGAIIDLIKPFYGCMGTETKSSWYSFTFATSGTFIFNVVPVNGLDDYDFAIWGPNAPCPPTNTYPIRCTVACFNTDGSCKDATTGENGASNPKTGLNFTATDVSEDAIAKPAPDGFLKSMNVLAGETYIMMMQNSQVNPNNAGFKLTMGGTATLVPCPPPCLLDTSSNSLTASKPTICAGDVSQLNFLTTIPNAANSLYTYTWSPSTGLSNPAIKNPTASPPTTTTYTLKVVDPAVPGCDVTLSIPVTVNTPPNAGTDGTVSMCLHADTISLFDKLGGTPAHTGTWTDMDGSGGLVGNGDAALFTPEHATPGATYRLKYTVTGTAPCPNASAIVTIQVYPGMTSLKAAITNEHCSQGDGQLVINATGGTAPYTFEASGGTPQSSNTFSSLSAGSISVTVTDNHGCSRDTSYTITNAPAITAITTTVTPTACTSNTGTVTVTGVTGGTGPYSYSTDGVTFQSAATFSNLPAGSVTIYVKDNFGCTYNSTAVIATVTGPTAITTIVAPTACTSNTGTVTVTGVTGGTSPYSYSTDGVTFQSAATFSNLPAGSVTIYVKDNFGCTYNSTAVIATVAGPTAITTTVTPTACMSNTGTVTVTGVTGGTSPYSYSTDGVTFQSTATFSNLPAGSVTIYVADNFGCAYNSTAVIVTVTGPTAITTMPTPAACGLSTGSIDITGVTGGTAAYSYSINGGTSSTVTLSDNLAAGTYSIEVTDANGCTYTASETVGDIPGVSGVTAIITSASCGAANGSIEIATVTGGSPAYEYSIDNGTTYQATTTFSGLQAASYTIRIKDANGCVLDTALAVQSLNGPVANLQNQTNVSCTGLTNGAATVTASGGSGTLTYSWNSSPAQSSASLTGVAAGSYVCTITDDLSCTATVNVTITEPAPIAVTITTIPAACGQANGSASATASGGTGTLSYSWSSPVQNTPNATGLSSGIPYTLVVTDASSCILDTIITINSSSGPSISLQSETPVSCHDGHDGSITVQTSGGTGTITFSWDTNPPQATGTATGLTAGTYTVTATDEAGCAITYTHTLNNPAAIAATFILTPQSCGLSNGAVVTTASGGTGTLDYSWNTSPVQTTADLSNLAPGTYTVTITDDNNCEFTGTVIITANAAPGVTITGTSQYCTGTTATLQTTPSFSGYSWSTGASTAAINATTADNPITITVTDAQGCTATSPPFNVTEGAFIETNSTMEICQGETAVIHGASQTTSGTYSKTYATASGCDSISNITLTVHALPVVNAGTDESLCNGEPVTPNASGATTYSWTGGISNGISFIPPVGVTSYTVTGIDGNGCTATDDLSITVHAIPTVSAGADIVACIGSSVTLSGSGATTYSWDNGITDNVPFTVSAGTTTYTLTGEDAFGCSATDQVSVTGQSSLVVDAGADRTICEGSPVTLTATGAATYTWDQGVVNGVPFTPSAGTHTYSVNGSDGSGCSDDDQVTVTVNTGLTVDAGNDISLCPGESVTLTATGATTYSWDNGITNGVAFIPATTQTYHVSGTAAGGCTGTDDVTVTVNSVSPVYAGLDVAVCKGVAVVLSGSNCVSYTWNNNVVDHIPFVQAVGQKQYKVTGTDANGCKSVDSVIVTMYSNPPVDAGNDQSLCEGQTTIVTASGATTYVWNYDVINGVPFTPDSTNTYVVTGTDVNGCQEQDSLEIDIEAIQYPSLAPGPNGCKPITATFSNTTLGVENCTWTFSDGLVVNSCAPFTRTFTEAGCYNVVLRTESVNGCIGEKNFTNIVCVQPDPVASFSPSPAELSSMDPSVRLINTSQNVVVYSWDFGDGTGSSEKQPTHQYSGVPGYYIITLTVHNENGCVDSTKETVVIREELLYYVPNTFTPDGNELNQYFVPVFTSGFDPFDYNMTIYDRWGEVIFESNNATIGWDGTYKGKLLSEGMYVWKIRFGKSDQRGRVELSGHVNLLR